MIVEEIYEALSRTDPEACHDRGLLGVAAGLILGMEATQAQRTEWLRQLGFARVVLQEVCPDLGIKD